MNIRTETRDDFEEVHELHVAAFGKREDEALLVERIRQSEGFIPELSIVAQLDGNIIGHALFSRASLLEGSEVKPVIVLAPIGVTPAKQKKGVGGQLIREGLKRCGELGYGVVLLIGHPSYYPKFGFWPARGFGLELKQFNVPDEVFMVCEVIEGALNQVKGELQYPTAFFDNN
ncbi:N-acetyltransferase [Cohnella pontilimi]|uniref:N-acetyltransferase n=1 Tax=Cohnella pontilimi TaxID=2564100 RepID=A0A4U0FG60_9BACL|nr:N-acetyltransferase [Cohnella pontilimi]TJY43881.1 N-acetyltransferase [Cohnella pontilimi]